MNPKPTNEAFERFRKLTQKVISVPKADVDALAKKFKARKTLKPKTA